MSGANISTGEGLKTMHRKKFWPGFWRWPFWALPRSFRRDRSS